MSQLGLSASVGESALMLGSVQVECDPASIEVGISCGMSDMCGESPCLCGAPDAWGDCACNGFETIAPTVTVSSSNALVAWPVQTDAGWELVSVLPGDAELTVSASLKHYDDAAQTLQVHSGGPSPCVLLGAALVVAVVVAAVFGTRAALRRRRAKAADAEGAGAQGEAPRE